MKKYKLFKISLSAAILTAAILFTGCPREAVKNEPPSKTNTHSIPKISFNLTNAEALGATITSSEDRSARAADDENKSDSEALLQKILEDGTVEAAMGIEGGKVDTDWSNINYVILPPEDVNSSDIYLLMNGYSTTEVTVVKKTSKQETADEDSTDDETVTDDYAEAENTNDETTEDEIAEYEDVTDESTEEEIITTNWTLSPLICIHEDNSYDDILLESPYNVEHYFAIDAKENIQFLKDGSVVYLYRGEGYDHFLNKWNPVTKKTTQLFKISLPEEEGSLFVRGFSISNDEDYIYMNLDRVDANGYGYNYLKIIRLSDPTFDKEIGNGFPGVTGWCYNPHDDYLYYSLGGLNKADKNGDNPELIGFDGYSHLIPLSSQIIWGQDGYTSTDFKIVNFLSEKTVEGLPTEELWYTAPEYYIFLGDYVFVNNTLYLNHRYNCDSTNGHKDAIIAIPLNNSSSKIKNLLDFNLNIQLHSWDVNEKSLFISGSDYETNELVNCKIDLETGNKTTIQSDSAFGSIAAF